MHQKEKNIQEQPIQENQGKYFFTQFPLYSHKSPNFINSGLGASNYILYGDENNYPDYLIYLYNSCSIHNAIINGKVRFIKGQGLKALDSRVQSFIESANVIEDADELLEKIIKDRRIFGGYYIKVVWTAGKPQFYHVPFENVRTNENYSKFFYSKKWTKAQSLDRKFKTTKGFPTDVKEYDPYRPTLRTGESIFFVYDYRPMQKGYPLPEYMACAASIETDIETTNYNLNAIKSGLTDAGIVTFFNGIPDEKTKGEIKRDLIKNTTGTDNAGNIFLRFTDANDKAPEFTSLKSTEINQQYEGIDKNNQQKIIIGHSVTNGMLFGLQTEGKLGGRNELDIAWKLFSLNYVSPEQQKLEKELNYLLLSSGVSSVKKSIEIVPLKGLPIEYDIATLKEYLTADEMRKMIIEDLGIEVQPQKFSKQINFDEVLINKFSKIGVNADEYEFASVSEDEQKLLDYIKGEKKIDIEKASKDLKINAAKVLQKLIEKNLIAAEVNSGIAEIKKIQLPVGDEMEVVTMWKYDWIDPKDASDIDNSRDFCRQLLSLNKLYTRAEIDALQNDMDDFNVDVWKYKGGWYHSKEDNVNYPSCRHYWNQVLVKRKVKK